ncbi:hypothetical protein [Actinoallomurus acaciae]|uniref:Uncharacterized protein n=1 Tax=Actinoallomurus acaciae TaxID=502577 RepID=A0ABV5YAF7_9ACTN
MGRRYMGCAGRIANGINTVHLPYARERVGHALISARRWNPAEQINVVIGLLIIGVSFVAGRDAKHPRCDGEHMSGSDVCISTRSGAQSYDQRASDARAASTWMLRIGGVLVLGGVGAMVIGGLTSARRD